MGTGRLPPTVRLIGIGWYFAVCIVLGAWGGVLLDSSLHTRPVFVLLGIFLGLSAAFTGGYRMLIDVLRDSDSVKKGGGE